MKNQPSATAQLTLGTGAFALCFAVFGSLSAMMPILSKQLHLTPTQKSIAVAVPVLLGSLGRIPLGMLTDRIGGRIVFSVVMILTIVPSVLMGSVHSYSGLIIYGFFIGIGLASFSVGVGFVSGWYSAAKQGTALGVYGAETSANLCSVRITLHCSRFWNEMGLLDVRSAVIGLVFDLCRVCTECTQESAPKVLCRDDATPC